MSVNGDVIWPPPSSDFAPFHVAVGWSNNPHMYAGYNTLPGAVLADPTDRGAIFGIEADYEVTPGTFWMEMYWQYNFQSGFTGNDCRRQIMAVIDKQTNIPVVLQLGGGPVQGISLNIIDGLGTDQQKIVGKQKVEVTPQRFTVYADPGGTIPSLSSSADGLRVNAKPNTYASIYFEEGSIQKWRLYNDFNNDRLFILNANATAGVYLDQNSGSWLSASDARLSYKKTGQTFSVLDKLGLFDVYEFTRDSGEVEISVKAQELHKAFPALVSEGDSEDREITEMDDPNLWAVKVDRAGLVALAGLKELMAKVEELSAKLAALEKKAP